MAIQVFIPKFRTEECLIEIKECLDKGWTGSGFKTQAFEEKWSQYTSLPHSHFLASNTVGLHLALCIFKRHFNWQEDNEIITSPLTFISSNHAILYENLTPVFADIDDTLCLDPQSIEQRITAKTRAVMYVGLGGNTGRLNEVAKICKKNNLKLILDAAHMAGTRYDGQHVGHVADVSVFSFQAVKNLPTADSGMICFQEKEFDQVARKLSWLGIDKDTYARTSSQGNYKWKYEVEELGYKYHGNSIMAALGLVGLKYLDEDNGYRRELARQYEQLLSHVPGIKFIKKVPNCESAQHLFQIRLKNRDGLISHLANYNIYPGVHYRDNTEYNLYRFAANQCVKARQASQELISLPLHLHLIEKDIHFIVESIKEFIDAPQSVAA